MSISRTDEARLQRFFIFVNHEQFLKTQLLYYNDKIMKIKLLFIAVCATMMACNNQNLATNRIELQGTVDNEAFANNVESISVMNLQMDDNWTFSDYMSVYLTDNYIYVFDGGNFMSSGNNMRILCFDRQTGGILSSRIIKGNGPGEIIEGKSIFCIDDTLCIYDAKKVIRKYDHNCSFVGKLHEFSDISDIYDIVRLNSGKYAFVAIVNSYTDTTNAALMLADESFNILSKHFPISPIEIMFIGVDEPCYVDGDTIRLICGYDNHLYTLYGNVEQCIELGLPNPITTEKANELFEKQEYQIVFDNFDGQFSGLCGSGRFLLFKYQLKGEPYLSMVDKRSNKVVSIPRMETEDAKTTVDLVNRIMCDAWAGKKSYDGYIYAICQNGRLDCWLEYYDELLDERLQKTRASYHACLERNAEYLKGLEPEERDEANVLIKIKLKD